MIKFVQGNILLDPSEAIVNPVNCVGVMGKGLALQFKEKYPENFKVYARACSRKQVHLGRVFTWKNTGEGHKWIVNFPTKRHWKDISYISDISTGVYDLYLFLQDHDVKSIAIPPLGCGLGGLRWDDVKSVILERLHVLRDTVDIYIYTPV